MKTNKAHNSPHAYLWLIVPCLVLGTIGPDLALNLPASIASMVFTMLGAAIGGIFFWLFRRKPQSFNILGAVGLGVLLSLALVPLTKGETLSSETAKAPLAKNSCPICGYFAVRDNFCEVCYNELTLTSMREEGYIDPEVFIRESQLIFFADEPGVTFRSPLKLQDDETYLKDTTWQPVVTAAAVDSFRVLE